MLNKEKLDLVYKVAELGINDATDEELDEALEIIRDHRAEVEGEVAKVFEELKAEIEEFVFFAEMTYEESRELIKKSMK